MKPVSKIVGVVLFGFITLVWPVYQMLDLYLWHGDERTVAILVLYLILWGIVAEKIWRSTSWNK